MLAICKTLMVIKVVQCVTGDDMLLQFTAQACLRNRAVVTGSKFIAFLEYRSYICIAPILRDISTIEGSLENHCQVWCKLICQVMKYPGWYVVWSCFMWVDLPQKLADSLFCDGNVWHGWIRLALKNRDAGYVFSGEGGLILSVQNIGLISWV